MLGRFGREEPHDGVVKGIGLLGVEPMARFQAAFLKLGKVGAQGIEAASHHIIGARAIQGEGGQIHRPQGQEGRHVWEVSTEHRQVVAPRKPVGLGAVESLEQELPDAGVGDADGQRGIDFTAASEGCLLYTSPSPRDS